MDNEHSKRLSDVHIINDSNISTSILSIPSFIKPSTINENIQAVKKSKPTILPAFHDPLFIEYTFYLPSSISKIITDKLPFKYSIIPENIIEIHKNDVLLSSYNVYHYGDSIKLTTNTTKIFIINQKKYIKSKKQLQNKMYKQCIDSQTKYTGNNDLEKYKSELFQMQVEENVNLFFIESNNDIVDSLKVIIKSFNVKCTNKYQKMKSFKDPNKYLQYVIGNIPGIGNNVGKSISSKFKNLYDFYCFILNEEICENKLEDIIVYSQDLTCERKLGIKQANIIRKVFTSDNEDDEF